MSNDALARIERCLDGLVRNGYEAKQCWRSGTEDAAKIEAENPARRMALAIGLFDSVLSKMHGFDPNIDYAIERELRLVPIVRAVDNAFRTFAAACGLPGARPDIVLLNATGYVKDLFYHMVKEWGWDYIIGESGLDGVADRLETQHAGWDRITVRAIRTWVELRTARGELCQPYAHEVADRAKERGWEPLPKVNEPDRAKWWIDRSMCHSRWQPALGTKHPEWTAIQRNAWHEAWRHVYDRVPTETPAETPEEARNRFCYEQLLAGFSREQVAEQVAKQIELRGWESLSLSGVNNRAKAYAKSIGKSLPKQPPGRKPKGGRNAQ